MSRVDVIVPCYNYGRYLRGCVESALGQAGVDVRVLILDDCSTDDTPHVASRLAGQDERVQYRRHATNHGHIATYNEGIDWAQADYLVLLSADDALTPGALRRAANLMVARPEVGLVFGRSVRVSSADLLPPVPDDPPEATPRVLSGSEFMERICRGEYPMPVSVVVRTAVQKAVGGWREDLPHAGDPEMWLRFAGRGPVGMLRSYQGYYRCHDQSMANGYRRSVRSACDQQVRAFQCFFQACGDRLPDAARLRRLWAVSSATIFLNNGALAFDQGDVRRARQWLAAARRLHPPVSGAASYRRLALKLCVGGRLWNALRPALAGVRRVSPLLGLK